MDGRPGDGALERAAVAEICGLAWPTILLSTAASGAFLAVTAAAIAGAMPPALAGVLNIPILFVAYTGVHEAVHSNFHGREGAQRWLNAFFGVPLAAALLSSFTLHRYAHLKHHSYTNDETRDPDAWVKAKSAPALILRALTLAFYHYVYVARAKGAEGNALGFAARVAVELALPTSAFVALAAAGHGWTALIAWALPAWLVSALLGFALDWAVHHPHERADRFGTTRIFDAGDGAWGRLFTHAYLFQNFHLIHHLFPRAPFYSYERIFRAGAADLRAAGVSIVRLGASERGAA